MCYGIRCENKLEASSMPGLRRTREARLSSDQVLHNVHVYLPYLAVAACCAAIVGYATRPQREF